MIHFVVWKWRHPTYRTKYTAEHVNVFAAMLARCFSGYYRLVCVTDDPAGVECETFPLWADLSLVANPMGPHFPSCYRRLKIFDRATQRALDFSEGDRVVSMDLDMVLVSVLDKLFKREEDFVGWQGRGAYNPLVYNGSLFMFRIGTHEWLWSDFDAATSPTKTRNLKYFGSDQGWFSHRLLGTGAGGWTSADGILSYASDMRRVRGLPPVARIVSFNGKLKPWDAQALNQAPWIAKHWRL